MTHRGSVPVSVWLLQMCVPLFALSAALVLMALGAPPTEYAARCPTHVTLAFLVFYGVMLTFGALFSNDEDLTDLKILAACFAPALLLILPHHTPYGARAGLWQEILLPSVAVIWAGVVTTFLHIRTAVGQCDVRARIAVPVSMCVMFITIEALLRPYNLLLNFAICVYALPVIVVSLRDHDASVPPAPS